MEVLQSCLASVKILRKTISDLENNLTRVTFLTSVPLFFIINNYKLKRKKILDIIEINPGVLGVYLHISSERIKNDSLLIENLSSRCLFLFYFSLFKKIY